jgi:hypothetical protein
MAGRTSRASACDINHHGRVGANGINFDYFCLDKEDDRYEAYVCRDGRTVTRAWTTRYGNDSVLLIVARCGVGN